MTSITFICSSLLFFTRILRLSFMGVVAINVLKKVCKEYSNEIEMQEASIREVLVLQEQVKMELLTIKILQISGLMQLFQLAGKW